MKSLSLLLQRLVATALIGLTMTAAASAQSLDLWRVLPGERGIPVMPGDATPVGATCADNDTAAALAAPLALADAIRIALCSNPRARQAWLDAAAQAATVGLSKAAYLPTVNASLSKSYDAVRTPGSFNSQRSGNQVHGANLTLSWLLLDSGGRAANVRQAEQNLAAAMAGHDGLLQSLFVGTAQAYYEAAAASASVRAAQQAEDTARESAQATETKLQLGAATVVDMLQARTALSQATLARVRVEGQARTSLGALAHVMGIDVRSPLQLAADADLDPLASTERPVAEDYLQQLDSLINEALAAHPTLLAARAQLASAEARLEAVRSEGFPSLTLTHSNFRNGRPGSTLPTSLTYERITAVTLSFPIFEGLSRNYRMHEQRAVVESRRADLEGVRSQVAFEVWRAFEALRVETGSVAASADLMRSAHESLLAAKARYQAGAAHTVDVLTAQKDEANARQERIAALASWRTSRLRLIAGLGRLGFWALGA
ncbi:TolC family protein [Roseateles toxinivorans]|uniref:Protein CyaE n=1 Tax=Roseateles toxinivorans TaxID=270368 RepID=A0A4R6QTX2_9BURK|nr:TolC family protein [Roseateles toxinivorans]TDP74706.1 outer membrane protein [Roseateles toxinivorans]